MGNSTITLQSVVLDAASNGDISPTLAPSGFATSPALSIANDVMSAMLRGGSRGQRFNFKFNRILIPGFPTISYQQDYASAVTTLEWLESGFAIDVNSASGIKLNIHSLLSETYSQSSQQSGYVTASASFPMTSFNMGTWETTTLANTSGLFSPGPNVVYTNPVGTAGLQPINPTTQIKDPNGNLLVLTTFGTCGLQLPPGWLLMQHLVETVTDGTCVWTVVNP